MLRRLILAALFATTPFAAPAEDCNAPGSTAAKPLAVAVPDDEAARTLGMAIVLGMSGEMQYHHLGLKIQTPRCATASASIGSSHYVLRAGDNSVWPRVAGENFDVVLAATLRPAAAAKLVSGLMVSRSSGAPSLTWADKADVIYILAVHGAGKNDWSIIGFYDAIPDTARLAQMMCQAAIGSLPVGAHFDAKTQAVAFSDVSAFTSFADRSGISGPCTVGPAP